MQGQGSQEPSDCAKGVWAGWEGHRDSWLGGHPAQTVICGVTR